MALASISKFPLLTNSGTHGLSYRRSTALIRAISFPRAERLGNIIVRSIVRPRTRSSSDILAVAKMIGMPDRGAPDWRSLRHSSKPSCPGSMTSNKISEGRSFRAFEITLAAVEKPSTLKPATWRWCRSNLAISGSSSTKKTFGSDTVLFPQPTCICI